MPDFKMAHVHMGEAEVAKNFAAVLEKVRQGIEVMVEQDHRPVAVIRPSEVHAALKTMAGARSRAPFGEESLARFWVRDRRE